MHDFKIGEDYDRKKNIHDKYGGNQQAGICPSSTAPYVFLFTGNAGEKFGYHNQWEDGVFYYIGAGRRGDMRFDHYNKPVRDHIKDGRDLLLFEKLKHKQAYRFLGQFACTGYSIKPMLDADHKMRNAIVFHLDNVDSEIEFDDASYSDIIESDSPSNLRKKAYAASEISEEPKASIGKHKHYIRNRDAKAYVLWRSKGKCECCGSPAPFENKYGEPYLEVHHIYKLSDKGRDTPDMMAALTPNCHRKIHHGVDGNVIDKKLAGIVKEKENFAEKIDAL